MDVVILAVTDCGFGLILSSATRLYATSCVPTSFKDHVWLEMGITYIGIEQWYQGVMAIITSYRSEHFKLWKSFCSWGQYALKRGTTGLMQTTPRWLSCAQLEFDGTRKRKVMYFLSLTNIQTIASIILQLIKSRFDELNVGKRLSDGV